jgi:hypothetical protein
VRDARAALDALREEENERRRREAEEAERLRQIQMREKLEVMRQKKQEYLQYQRQVGYFCASATPCASPPPQPSIFLRLFFLCAPPVYRDDRQLRAHAMARQVGYYKKTSLGSLL